MKLTAQVKLVTTPAQKDALIRTMRIANAACNHAAKVAFENGVFGQFALHKLVYTDIRATFGLSAQMAVRCIAKVADAYKLDKKTQRKFKPTGAIAYDLRILRWRLAYQNVSIWTIDGREKEIPFVAGARQLELLKTQQGETDLTVWRGEFYLNATCNVEELADADVTDTLGIDLGITNIATDSDGEVHSGKGLKNVRHRHRRLRAKLQAKGTRSAKRRLRKLSGKERRFGRWVNHNISKRIVAKAKDTNRAIGVEDLKDIRTRITARRSQRAALHSWSFFQLRAFLEYKARRLGVPVVAVDPRNTSRECHECGHIEKANRPNQHPFLCVKCGHAAHADLNAALNVSRRATSKLAERATNSKAQSPLL